MDYDEARNILNVSTTATKEEIKRAWRAKVREVHPDHGGSESEFKQVQEAYSLLSTTDAQMAKMEEEIFDTIFTDIFSMRPRRQKKSVHKQSPSPQPKIIKIRIPKEQIRQSSSQPHVKIKYPKQKS